MGGGIKRLVSMLLGAVSGGQRDKSERMQRRRQLLVTVELRVRMDCERCERQVRRALAGMRGVQHVEVSRRQQKVTATGSLDPHEVLRRIQSTGKKAELWPQYPGYGGGAAAAAAVVHCGLGPPHDRWAPACHPRNMDAAMGAEHIANLFSDDNPNACSLM
ncbi:heavy metal-associated isoprenylated plant protein 20-like [Oryza brachyantha]|uniref:heavy metal-associated isoprenylated plant protein 20-like n=1 Tax=Oryza brachyantha TaxID=4533 RepID=UPI001ADAC279|nr:heavy metal-associated isoprenylated plant protein 20-like [Oryza brachyantha]